MFRILLSESAINRQDLAGIPNPRAALRSTELFTPTNTQVTDKISIVRTTLSWMFCQASSYGAYLGFSFVLVEIKKPGASGDELEDTLSRTADARL